MNHTCAAQQFGPGESSGAGGRGVVAWGLLVRSGVRVVGQPLASGAAGALEQGLRIASETGAGLVWEALMLALLARAYLELGENRRARATVDEATRQRELGEAHRLFTEMGATGHAERLAKEPS